MKKRVCRRRCESCGINFETLQRFSIHLASRAHLMQGLQTQANDILLVSDDDITLSADAWDFEDRSLVPVTAELNLVGIESLSHEENLMDMDVDMDGFSDTSDAEVDGESSTTRNQQNAYFPFPSEVFFLLYSYAHNTSRPIR